MSEIRKIFTLDPGHCTERVLDALENTLEIAKLHRYEFITPELLLCCIMMQKEFIDFCDAGNIDQEGLKEELNAYISHQDTVPFDEEQELAMSVDMQGIIHAAKQIWIYRKKKHKELRVDIPISMLDIIFNIYNLESSMAKFLLGKYINEEVEPVIDNLNGFYANDMEMYFLENAKKPVIKAEAYINGKKVDEMSGEELFGKMMESANRLMGALHSLNVTANNDSEEYEEEEEKPRQREPWEDLVTCISDTYKTKKPLIGREQELSRAIRILCRKDKNNPLFIGEPGVGKTAMIYGLARIIDEGNVPEWLKGQRIYELDMGSMVAGASYSGEFEKRMKTVLEGARNNGRCILYIDEIHSIMGSSNGGNQTNAADLLKPYLDDGAIRFVGSTTYQDYNKQMANNKAIARRFGQIDIKEPSVDETMDIITQLLPIYEKHHGVRYDATAVRYAVEQTDSKICDRFLPDKAIDVIDEAGAYRQQHPLVKKDGSRKAPRYQKVDTVLIRQILTEICRIDAKSLSSESNEELKNLEERIGSEIYGQDDAIAKVVESVMLSKAGLAEPEKPMASLLFVGPTGVGKTELCKVLAKEMGIELIRFDMSEYTEKHTVSKLIGSPAGYIGYDEGGLLTDAIRRTPNCVLLLDEIEKAHSDIYNILLQVMDYAKLTDNKGNKADFKNVILVMTSNAGAQFAGQAAIGFGGGLSKGEAMMNTVKKTFKPEFLNRLSGTVVFNDMDRTMASLILDRKLKKVEERLAAKGVTMNIDDEARQFLLEKGFTTQYGAREMDRTIQQHLTPLLMREILFGKLRKGGEAIVSVCNGSITIG